MDRVERLVNLVALLLDAEVPVRAADIARKVPGYPPPGPAFRRAFERDKDTLRRIAIPLAVEHLEGGDDEASLGYRIPRQRYELADPGLNPDEVAALYLAAGSVRLEGAETTAAIWKLGGVTAINAPELRASLPGSEHLAALFGAVREGLTVRFDYRGAPRTVDPWRLGFRNRFWYLSGWDHDRGERRTFRLDRLRALTVGPEAVGHPPAAGQEAVSTSPPWELGDAEPVEVVVHVDADQARWAVQAAGPHAVRSRDADGSVELTLRVTNRSALHTFVLGMLEHAEILSPPAERFALVEWVRAAPVVQA